MTTSPKAQISEPPSHPEPGAAPAATPTGAPVELHGVGHRFAALTVLDSIDLAVAPGEVLGLVGPSGCGKSTLLELVGGLSEPAAGSIAVGGATTGAERLARCAHMPQRDLLLPWLTALDNAALAPRNRGASKRDARELARPLFARFGLDGFESARPTELSGGMRQRVAFLRTLLADKPVLLLDEPFAALDAITRSEMQEWLADALAAEPATAIVVTHDVEEALYLCDRVAVLSPRPGRVLGTVRSPSPRRLPRRETVTSPQFGTVRERALELLSRDGHVTRHWLPPLIVVVALLGLWELAARWDLIADALQIKPFLIPAPSDIAESLVDDRALLAADAWVTAQEVVLGFAIAAVLGFGFAVVMHLSDLMRRSFYPLLVASQTIPIVAIAPILVVWLGFGIGPKLAIVALICFFPITVNTLDGLRSVDPEMTRMMRSLDAGRAQTLRRVEIPSALPFLLSGAKIAAVIAVIGAVFGEWSGSDDGLGHLILVAQGQLQTARVFAAVVVLSAIALILFGVLALLERRLAWWGRPTEAAG